MSSHPVVDDATWLRARIELLEKEKELKKRQDELAKTRQALPWRVVKDYEFEGPSGPVKLSDLFGTKSDLLVYHLMFDTDWTRACSSCSTWCDGINGILPHLKRKCEFAVIAKAPIAKLTPFRESKGWNFPVISAGGCSFGRDFGVEFTPEEVESKAETYNYGRPPQCPVMPGASVFHRGEDGTIYHTYSMYARGLEQITALFPTLDVLPFGRNEKTPMDFIKHKEDYDSSDAPAAHW